MSNSVNKNIMVLHLNVLRMMDAAGHLKKLVKLFNIFMIQTIPGHIFKDMMMVTGEEE